MKTIFKVIILFVIFTAGTISAIAASDGPLVIMGNVTYNSLGTEKLDGMPENTYSEFLETKFVNAGIPVKDKEGVVEKFAEEENRFWGYKKYNTNLPEPKYRIDASINVTRTRYGDDSSRQDISIAVRIFDIETGKLIDQATESRRNVNPYANLQIVGPQPTWWERYVSGYTREIKYDDPIREAIDKASKTIVDKISALDGQKAESDAERFLKNIEQNKIRQQQSEPNEKLKETSQENSGSKYITWEELIEKCGTRRVMQKLEDKEDYQVWCFSEDPAAVDESGSISWDVERQSRPPDYLMTAAEWDRPTR